jgi:Na+/melibiose symporter-like transporter
MTHSQLIRYALLAMPLAFAALPLYVLLPNYYATHYGLSLGTLGSLLLLARLCDAIADPLIGHYVDRVFTLGKAALMRRTYLAALLMIIGFIALWWAPRIRIIATEPAGHRIDAGVHGVQLSHRAASRHRRAALARHRDAYAHQYLS